MSHSISAKSAPHRRRGRRIPVAPLPVFVYWEDDVLFRIFPLSLITGVACGGTPEDLTAFIPAWIFEKPRRKNNTTNIRFSFKNNTLYYAYKPKNTDKKDRRKTPNRNTLNAKNRIRRQFFVTAESARTTL
jgi:hypothetical protein